MRHLILFFLLPAAVWAQTGLTIEQAMQQAVTRHPAVQAAAARTKAARAQTRQAIGYRLPSVDVAETFIRTNNPAEAFAFQMNQERFSMAEFGNPANDPNNPDLLNTYMTRAEATLPVFTGGMLHGRTMQAHSMAKAATQDETRTRENVALDATTAWLNLSKAREFKDLMQRSLATAEAHAKRADDFFKQGMLAPHEILRAQVFVAEMREYRTRADEQEQLAQAALNFNLGNSQDTPITLAEAQPATVEDIVLDAAVKQALNGRPDLLAAREKLKAGRLEVTVARSSFLPQVGIVGRYDMYDDKLLGDHGSSWAIMGQAKLNLFRGGADRHAWQKAALDAKAGAADVRRFEEGVTLEVRQALAEQTSAGLRAQAATAALTAGRENLRVTEVRYAQGIAKMTDLLDAQTALRELEVRELTARYDVLLAGYRIRFVTGQTLLSK
ncbi:MAG: TolC family protein [bacterium]|nr:TolC family protein [bacterium]